VEPRSLVAYSLRIGHDGDGQLMSIGYELRGHDGRPEVSVAMVAPTDLCRALCHPKKPSGLHNQIEGTITINYIAPHFLLAK